MTAILKCAVLVIGGGSAGVGAAWRAALCGADTVLIEPDTLLGAVTGGVSYMINTLRSFCLGSRWKFAHSRGMCAIICAMQLAALAFTWSGWISILPVAANIAATLGGYTHNPRKIRIAGMFVNSPLWIVYDLCVGSWAGILDEAVTEGSMILSIIRFGWKNLDREEM